MTDAADGRRRRRRRRSRSARRARERDPATGERRCAAEQPSDLARLVDAIVEANAAEGIARAAPAVARAVGREHDSTWPETAARRGARRRSAPPAPVPGRLGARPRATCCCSASPAAARRRRSRASRSASPTSYAPDDARAVRARLRHRRPGGARGPAAHRLGDRRRRPRAPGAADAAPARASSTSGAPASRARRTVVLIDNLAAMRAEFDDVEGMELMDELTRVYADGPAGRASSSR